MPLSGKIFKIRFSFTFLMMVIATLLSAQVNHPVKVAALPEPVYESSGLEFTGPNELWSHNDSGDLPRIFRIDSSGNLLHTLNFSSVKAVDYEDMAQDSEGNFYIGDFGNNLNNRTDLTIYKIPDPKSVLTDSVQPVSIYFHYPDQHQFPPSFGDWNFDCEALFHYQDSLYLFSKNRGVSSYTRMYILPDIPGTYTARLADSFDTRKWITGADISPSGKSMVLLSYDRLWLFTDYGDNRFFIGKAQEILIDSSQKEGVVFMNDSTIYITDELFLGIGGNLYSMGLESYINGTEEPRPTGCKAQVFPNPAEDETMISIHLKRPVTVNILLLDPAGCLLQEWEKGLNTGNNQIPLDLTGLPPGIYLLLITSGSEILYSEKIVKMKA